MRVSNCRTHSGGEQAGRLRLSKRWRGLYKKRTFDGRGSDHMHSAQDGQRLTTRAAACQARYHALILACPQAYESNPAKATMPQQDTPPFTSGPAHVLTRLAFSIYGNPGVYAILVGSGLSRAADGCAPAPPSRRTLRRVPGIAFVRPKVLCDGSSAQFGFDAVAGVINLRPQDAPSGRQGHSTRPRKACCEIPTGRRRRR